MPTATPVAVRPVAAGSSARPKSTSFSRPLADTITLAGLHVPVDDAMGVGLGKGVRDLAGEVERFCRRHRAAFDAGAQGLALAVGHGEEQFPARQFLDVVDGADVRMIEKGRRPRLLHQPGLGRGVGGQALRQQLECHSPPEPLVLREEHLAHRARAQLADDAVVRDAPADHGWRPPRSSSERRDARDTTVARRASQREATREGVAFDAAAFSR